MEQEIIYIGDPMCSWCWGFAPVVDRMRTAFEDRAGFRIIVGGLRPGSHAQRMTETVGRMIRGHWKHVEEASGQPFNYEFFDREDFLYDTEPAARAVVAVREIAPEKEFPFFKRLQHAFYAQNVDITQPDSYPVLLEAEGIGTEQFNEVFDTETNREATQNDFATAVQWGIRGFPSVVLRKGDELALLTAGYRPYAGLEPLIERYFGEKTKTAS